ncbi:nucleotidyl transferase AbiEii/AbiGii toxin family protein [Salinibacter altiplanensis]|uniref:nucleotidyl transferase AbiEii/AbiGii toxin family protein n=1 Tax=Salinibacter altiplanensis TaxID=1803181 RepID=UPI000C9EF0D9|nr:nucleotidyl transferase AbiEii/AbiGii toxin family protein [Salinibacter altiplanensis]
MPIQIATDDAELQLVKPILVSLHKACRELGIDFYIIGALARNIHLRYEDDIDVPRQTRDVDVAAAVEGWGMYEALKDHLIEDYGFTDDDQKQRVCSPGGVDLDLVPFGGIEDSSGRIRFPPDERPEMTVLGLEEARRTTVSLELDNEVSVEVVSLPALGMLKLIAWDERPRERVRDAQDLCFIMRQYFDAYLDTILNEHADLFDEEDFSRPLTSARAYGREMASLLMKSEILRSHIIRMLERETEDVYQSNLADAMDASGCHRTSDLRFESLESLLTGIVEKVE